MRIKFVSKTPPDEIERLWDPLLQTAHLPDHVSVTFNPDARDYDFLIVYEDLPPLPGERKILRTEQLACAKENTLLIATEPASIRIDGAAYIQQFGAIWTSRPAEFTPGLARIATPPPLRFFHGRNLAEGPHRNPGGPIAEKSRDLSAMSSKKAMNHTLHSRRLAFILEMKSRFGDGLDLFGRGFAAVDDKAEAMDAYRYHIAIENHEQDGHITEKLTDCFLAGCLPFYFGASDYASYFPQDAVIPIDIMNPDGAETTIRSAIESNAFEARRHAIEEARNITLKTWNTVNAACNVAADRYDSSAERGGVIHGRHAFRRAHPVKAVQDALFVMKARRGPLASPLQTEKQP